MTFATHTIEGAVSVVTMQRPERLNAISDGLLRDLRIALDAAHSESSTRAIVFTGAGRAFCAGDDLKEFGTQSSSPAAITDTCERIQDITRAIMLGPKIVVGAVHGYAVGGGFEWLLNCDLVVASDSLICFFPEMALGHFVTGGVTHWLPQTLGHQRTMELLVLGDRQSATDLKALGLVNRVVPHADMLATAMALAAQVATRSPTATARLKRVLTTGLGEQLQTALAVESREAQACFADPDTAQRIAAFSQQRL